MASMKTYRVFAKIFKKNITDMIVSDSLIYPPKGYILAERGYLTEEEYEKKKENYENFQDDYLGYPVYKFRYKRGIKEKNEEMIEEDKRDIETRFEEWDTITKTKTQTINS